MDDDLIPSAPQHTGHENRSNEKPADKRADHRQEHLIPTNGNKGKESKLTPAVRLLVVVIIEALACILWEFSDGLHGYSLVCGRWLSSVCFVAGAVPYAHKALKRPKAVWSVFVGTCAVLAIVCVMLFRPAEPAIPPAPPPVVLLVPRILPFVLQTAPSFLRGPVRLVLPSAGRYACYHISKSALFHLTEKKRAMACLSQRVFLTKTESSSQS